MHGQKNKKEEGMSENGEKSLTVTGLYVTNMKCKKVLALMCLVRPTSWWLIVLVK